MKTIGITGIIGSGKSTICQIFEHFSIPVFYSDDWAKLAYNDNQIVEKVKKMFGNVIFNAQNELDKTILSSIVFNDKIKLQQLNNIVHPFVINNFIEWKKKQKSPYILFESAIIFDCAITSLFDDIIIVDIPEKEAIERVMNRNHISQTEILQRIENQKNVENNIDKVRFVIDNSEKSLVLPQIQQIHQILAKN